MSETYHSTLGQQIFTDVSASGSSSGRDRFERLDATTFYHNDRDYQAPGTLRLSGQDSNYAHGHPFAYASHSGPPSLPSKRALSYHGLSLRTVLLHLNHSRSLFRYPLAAHGLYSHSFASLVPMASF